MDMKVSKHEVDLRSLKDFVLKNLPPNSILRDFILSEHDHLEYIAFCVKLDIWLKLLSRSNKN